MLMGILALLALSLAAVGLFGVVSYAVSRRVREMPSALPSAPVLGI